MQTVARRYLQSAPMPYCESHGCSTCVPSVAAGPVPGGCGSCHYADTSCANCYNCALCPSGAEYVHGTCGGGVLDGSCGGLGTCEPCTAGTAGVAGDCTACPPADAPTANRTSCESCATYGVSYYGDGRSCQECARGYQPNAGRDGCDDCPAGTKSPDGTPCQACTSGQVPNVMQVPAAWRLFGTCVRVCGEGGSAWPGTLAACTLH